MNRQNGARIQAWTGLNLDLCTRRGPALLWPVCGVAEHVPQLTADLDVSGNKLLLPATPCDSDRGQVCWLDEQVHPIDVGLGPGEGGEGPKGRLRVAATAEGRSDGIPRVAGSPSYRHSPALPTARSVQSSAMAKDQPVPSASR